MTNIIEDPPQNPYTTLKAVLLKSHQLTDFQRVEKLHQLEPLGGRKPSELLAIMLEICPMGQHTSLFFQYLYPQRLPRELRIMLAEDDHADLRKTAEKADTLWAIHAKQSHDVVAAVKPEADSDIVAAIPSRGGGTRGVVAALVPAAVAPAAVATAVAALPTPTSRIRLLHRGL